jgi:L-fucose mutarotase/ribose pyranase (RbsD/FucU family)
MSEQTEEFPEPSWEAVFGRKLPVFGHRNWIVIADAAYPSQSGAGITTIVAEAEQLDVVKSVLSAIAASSHVKAMIHVDRELHFVDEQDAPGASAYREKLGELLKGHDAEPAPHEEIIARLDQAGRMFHVLIIKTGLTIPYTSVFLELDCAYWNADAEARLRAAMRG